MAKKQVSARIDVNLINDYVDQFNKFREEKFKQEYPLDDLTITKILEDALFFAEKYLEEKNSAEK